MNDDPSTRYCLVTKINFCPSHQHWGSNTEPLALIFNGKNVNLSYSTSPDFLTLVGFSTIRSILTSTGRVGWTAEIWAVSWNSNNEIFSPTSVSAVGASIKGWSPDFSWSFSRFGPQCLFEQICKLHPWCSQYLIDNDSLSKPYFFVFYFLLESSMVDSER